MADNSVTMLAEVPRSQVRKTAFTVLAAISFCHLLNDLVQSLVPAIYPLLKTAFNLDFGQIGMITLTYQITASLLQPLVGYLTDRRPMPYSLAAGMSFTLVGLVCLSVAPTYPALLGSAMLVGVGSAVFHPESSRVARLASGGQHGLAQSLFQVGGNAGSASGPLLAAFVVLPHGQRSIAWFSLVALLGIGVLSFVGAWSKKNRPAVTKTRARKIVSSTTLSPKQIWVAMGVLVVLIFSKYFYLVSLTNYFTFYLMHKFNVSVQNAQLHLFAFLGAVAAGTIIGGPVGDRFGRKFVIWWSILGILPFTLLLPYANLFWTGVLTVIIGLILASAFSAILVYAQELVPGRVGMISGIFFGFAFGMAGLGAAVLGKLADYKGIDSVYQICAFLPVLGIFTAFLPGQRQSDKAGVSSND
jgi:FSR family fosmidomycin resistance protein-like MFS transporter